MAEDEWPVWSEAWATEAEWASGPRGRKHGQRCPNATVKKLGLGYRATVLTACGPGTDSYGARGSGRVATAIGSPGPLATSIVATGSHASIWRV